MQTLSSQDWMNRAIIAAMAVLAVVMLLPFAWLFSMSFRPVAEAYRMPPSFLPPNLDFANYIAVLKSDVPFLAIGRGLHVLTVARGGTLAQHLPAHRPDRARYLPHDVHLADDSVLGRLLGSKVQVPAAHHQAPDRLGDGLTVTGWSPDDQVTEAVEVTGHVFGVGVHWHPEESDDLRLLTALVEAAAKPRREQAKRAEPQQPSAHQQPRKPAAVKPKAGTRR